MKQTILRFGVMAASATLPVGCSTEAPANDPVILLVAQDSAPTGTRVVDGGLSKDAGTPDSAVVLLDEPLGRVYLNDPATDNGALSEVTLHSSTDPMGKLTSEWVQVFNCLNEDGGVVAMPDVGGFNITIALCNEKQTVTPDPDGHYLSIEPPQTDSDPNDQFAELMMYHHVNLAHDYFKETHGFADLDYPLPALVNVQVKVDPPLPFLNAGPDGWIGLSNAAFFPKEAWRQFAAQFGLPRETATASSFFRVTRISHMTVGSSTMNIPTQSSAQGVSQQPRCWMKPA